MTLQKIPENLGFGGAHLNRSVLRKILAELQAQLTMIQGQVMSVVSATAVRTTVVNGAFIDTDIPIAGISTEDTLLGVVKLDFALTEGTPNTRAWSAADLLSEARVTSDGNIQLNATATTGAVLLVTWLDRGG